MKPGKGCGSHLLLDRLKDSVLTVGIDSRNGTVMDSISRSLMEMAMSSSLMDRVTP